MDLTLEQAKQVLEFVKANGTFEQVQSLPYDVVQRTARNIGEALYTFYKHGEFDLEMELAEYEEVFMNRQIHGNRNH